MNIPGSPDARIQYIRALPQPGDVVAKVGLASGQQIERVEPLVLDGLTLMDEPLFELVGRFMDDGNGFIHQVHVTTSENSSGCR